MPGERADEWVRRVLKADDARDKQRAIGPSEIANPCTRCLADRLSGIKQKQGRYWMGARIGTAIHFDLEDKTLELDGVLAETKVVIGELPGYGLVKGTSDCLWSDLEHLLDYKTTTKDKLKWIKQAHVTEPDKFDVTKLAEARFKVLGYIAQTHLYAYGVVKSGQPVEKISITYIARDGSTDADIWSFEMDYNPDLAQHVWDRLVAVWEAIQGGKELDTFESHQYCYTCTRLGRN